MMKTVLTLLLFFVMVTAVTAQDLLDTLASQSCTCINKLDLKAIPQEEMNMKVGTCIIQVSMPYSARLRKDHDINLDELNEETGVKLGRLVVTRMLTICPETLGQLGKSRASGKAAKLTTSGLIQEVLEGDFVTVTVLNDKKMILKFIWLKNFPGSNDLAALKKPKGKKVKIDYEVNEFYDPRIKDYRVYNVITSLEFPEE